MEKLHLWRRWLVVPVVLLLVGLTACGGTTIQTVMVPVTTTPPPATPVLPTPVSPTVPPTAVPTAAPTSAPTPVPPTIPTPAETAIPPTVPTAGPTAVGTSVGAPTITPPAGTPVVCDEVPIRGFGKVWAEHPEVPQGLGCPAAYYYCAEGYCSGEQAMVSAVERFEHGTMLWVNVATWEGTHWVYVLFEDGTYQRFEDTFQEGVDPVSDTAIVPPAGLYQPIRGFGKVWREGTGAQVRERLGWAVEPEMGGDGAWQSFWRGMMFWIGPVDRIYVLFEYDAEFNPVHKYEEFRDTF